jgi:hypothetical protein
MLRLLRFLITGSWHEHTYEIIEERAVCSGCQGAEKGFIYVSRCTVCGKIKSNQITLEN